MPRHPNVYAQMLGERMDRFDVPVWLVNTGWTGGPYGTGERMNITWTRQMVRAALSGKLNDVPTRTDPIFGFEVPTDLPRCSHRGPLAARHVGGQGRLRPEGTQLAQMFVDNFRQFEAGVSDRGQWSRAQNRLTRFANLAAATFFGSLQRYG